MIILKQTHGELSPIINKQMNDYTKPEYKGLYQEILKDYNFRFGKFSPIPYPIHPQITHHESQRKDQTSK